MNTPCRVSFGSSRLVAANWIRGSDVCVVIRRIADDRSPVTPIPFQYA